MKVLHMWHPMRCCFVAVVAASSSHVKLSRRLPILAIFLGKRDCTRRVNHHGMTDLYTTFANHQWLPWRWTQLKGIQTSKMMPRASASRHRSFLSISVSDLLSMVYSIPSRRKASTTLYESRYGLSTWKACVVPPSGSRTL